MGLGHYLNEIGKYPKISIKNQFSLIKRVWKGNSKAREELIHGNLKRVVDIASKYKGIGLTEGELICAGNYGLIKAIDKYSAKNASAKNIQSYIYSSIEDEIEKEIKNQNWIANYRGGARIAYIIIRLNKKLGKEPALKEIKKEFLISLKKDGRSRLKKKLRREPTDKEVKNKLPFKDDDPFIDIIVEAYSPTLQFEQATRGMYINSLEEMVIRKKQKEKLYAALSTLELREQEILMRNFGLGDYDVHSLENISKIMGVTRERIRQLKEKAERKLKIALSIRK